jgi:hypothetical protein
VFVCPYDEEKYWKIVHLYVLEPDFETFLAGIFIYIYIYIVYVFGFSMFVDVFLMKCMYLYMY